MELYTVAVCVRGNVQLKTIENVILEGLRISNGRIYIPVYKKEDAPQNGGEVVKIRWEQNNAKVEAEGIYIDLDDINNFYIKKQKEKMIEKTLVVENHDGTTARYGGLIEVFERQFGMVGDKELSFMTKQQIVKKTILTTYHLPLDNIRSYAVEEIEIDAEDDAV